MSSIEQVIAGITERFDARSAARDHALVESRQIVRHAANGIRALHRAEFDSAQENLTRGKEMVEIARRDLRRHPDLYWAGYVQDAQKEIAEAFIVAAMIRGEQIPPPEDIGVEDAPYLNGMAEAASEMRRYVLDTIRRGGESEMRQAERILGLMDDVYTGLLTVDFPDAVTGGLRRTVDQLRGVLERTRGDLTISIRQAELERALAQHR